MAKIVKPKNVIKEKVGNGGFKEENLEKAQTVIEENDIDFQPIGMNFLKNLEHILEFDSKNFKEDKQFYMAVMDPLMQLRAQGSMFHYPSVTLVTDIMVDFLDSVQKTDEDILSILSAYMQTTKTILKLEIQDDKDKTCNVLATELNAVCERYKKKNNI